MAGGTLSRVVASKDSIIKDGMAVYWFGNWEEFSITDGNNVKVVEEQKGIPLSYYLGILGMPGKKKKEVYYYFF